VLLDDGCELPASLKEVETIQVGPVGELAFSRKCSLLSRTADLYFSPYPKLPITNLKCPSIHTVHDVFYLTHSACRKNMLRTMIARWLLRRSISKAALTWFVSQASQQACEALVGAAKHAEVRYSPVEAFFSPSDERKLMVGTPYFLCVGNGMPHKNVEVLLQATQGREYQLKCVGVGEASQARLRALYPHLGECVQFLKSVNDQQLVELYRNAVALLLPSTEEGYGFTPLEAMACGTPTIVSDIPVLRESTGDMAVFCPPHDATAWQRAMDSMLDVSVRERQSLNVLQWVQCRQGQEGWRKHIEDLEAVISRG